MLNLTTMITELRTPLEELVRNLEGDFYDDELTRRIYATDASVYRKLPLAVVLPKSSKDLGHLIDYANLNSIGLIPRTAGTSLAGQCVGDGLVVDVSKHFTEIISLDKEKKQVTVQPGVIRDALNVYLKLSFRLHPAKLHFLYIIKSWLARIVCWL